MKLILEKYDIVVIEPKKVAKSEKSKLMRMGDRKTGVVEAASGDYRLAATVHSQIGSFPIPEDMSSLDRLKDVVANLDTSYFGSGYGLADKLAERGAKIRISNPALKKGAVILLFELVEDNKTAYATHEFDDLIAHINGEVKTVN